MRAERRIKRLLQERVIILDGAMGTELQKRGLPPGMAPEIWCLDHASVLRDIHRSYRQAGADMIYTATFGANRCKLSSYLQATAVGEINRRLVEIAREAGGEALIAGDIGPTGRFVAPFGDLDFEEAIDIYKEQVAGLLAGGVDLFVIETMMDIQEARAALLAVKESGDYFTLVTMTFEKDGRTLNGTDAVTALITLQSLGADAVGCNCSLGPDGMVNLIAAMKPNATVPLVAKPNAGMPKLKGERTVFDLGAREFALYGERLLEAGANFIGGCCGTTPEHIRILKERIGNRKPIAPLRKSLPAVSSARGYYIFQEQAPLSIIGERLNPTGKKALQEELLAGRTSLIRKMAREQEELGAAMLDVNVGVPGLDEAKAIKDIISILSVTTALPLVIDSSSPETIEAALRFYPGRMLINSISGETAKLTQLLPLAAKYGAMFILLPVGEGELPKTWQKRATVVREIFRKARSFGFTKDDIIVDGLVMTVASDSAAAVETLKTIAWCREVFRAKTVLGISNVSFGMPERRWLNATFLAMAQAMGLTTVIANPASEELMHVKAAGDLLMNRDRNASFYLARFASMPKQKSRGAVAPAQKVALAVEEGDREGIITAINEALQSGFTARDLVDQVMIPAIVKVGDLFEKKTYFLPQLMASAEAMKIGLSFLEPKLLEKDVPEAKGVIILATVKGDIHDIGKNIVALMLKNHGYKVIDLGKDVANEEIIAAIKQYKPHVVGLSALMTTTMVRMKEVIELATQEGLKCSFIVGGAVLSKAYASSIGAHYAKDGVEAVKVVTALIKGGINEGN